MRRMEDQEYHVSALTKIQMVENPIAMPDMRGTQYDMLG